MADPLLLTREVQSPVLLPLWFGPGGADDARGSARSALSSALRAPLCVLFLIGAAHFLLLWDGDILHDYALLGFVLLLFRRCSPKTLLVGAGVLLAIPMLFYGITTYYSITGHVNPQVKEWITYENGAEDDGTIDDFSDTYSRGSYAEMITLRASELPRDMSPDTEDAYVLAIFLLGLYAGRRRIFHDISTHLPFIRRVQRGGLIIGVAGNAAFAVGGAFDPSPTSIMQNVGRLCLVVAAPAMMLFYASTIILMTQREIWRRRLAPLAAVGRTALSK